MKGTLYRTNNNHILSKKRLFDNAQENDWISRAVISDKPVTESFNGFGVALTGSSCYELSVMPPEQRESFLEDIYGKGGLNFSVARLSMGSSDYSPSVYSYCDTPGDTELKTFSVDKDREFIIPMIKEVLKHNADIKFLASPWSPPGWMKTGGLLSCGYMRDTYIDCYADYFIKYIKAYGKEGIKINAVTPQNEPESHQNGTSVACIWAPDTEAKFIIALKEKMLQNGIDTEIWMYDHCFIGWPRIVWTLNEYPKLREYVDSVALHYYEGGIELTDNIKSAYPEMKWNFTEGGPRLYDNYDTDWLKWSLIAARSLAHGCESFLGWNLLLDEDGGPNIGPFPCAGLATLDSQTGELTYSGQYHALGHFSKFIQRGAKIYSVKISDDYNWLSNFPRNMNIPIEAVAADNPDGTHVMVLVNPSERKGQVQYFYGEKCWYIELMPNSVSTVVFE
ncbi:MAG: hypothetical protein PUF72_10165 [Clostridiales bacterium]|nr:hypothetical protein [Clostridiales bacterium]